MAEGAAKPFPPTTKSSAQPKSAIFEDKFVITARSWQEDHGKRDLARGGATGPRKKLISRLPLLPLDDSP